MLIKEKKYQYVCQLLSQRLNVKNVYQLEKRINYNIGQSRLNVNIQEKQLVSRQLCLFVYFCSGN